jgi:hypothetical protein
VTATRNPEQRSIEDTIKPSKPRAFLAGALAAALLAGIALAVYKSLLTDDWPLLKAGLLLAALTPPYAWALHKMFLYSSGDAKAAKRRTVIAILATAGVAAAAVVITLAVELLAGLIGFGFGGDSDDDSDSSSDSSSGSGWGWHFGGLGTESSAGRHRGGGESPHYGSGESAGQTRGGLCAGCGRHTSSDYGLCVACSMPRY